MLIQNINNTSNRLPNGFKTWIEFWEKKTLSKAKHGFGGHVLKYNSTDKDWYIADITHEQNMKTEPYEYSGKLAKLTD